MRTGAAFGNGIYLSDSLSLVTQNYAPPQQLDLPSGGWRTERFGRSCAAVAICLVIKHPDTLTRRAADGVPDKYWVVSNEQHVRVVGLLLYSDRADLTAAAGRSSASRPQAVAPVGSVGSGGHGGGGGGSLGLVFGYVLVLVLIACAQSPAALLRPPLRMWNALLAAIGLSPE